jgi:hydrogenase expression/formation protein HypC
MCLAIPGKVVEIFDRQGLRMARVQFGGIWRDTCLECVPDAGVGSYVLVHVGFALSVIDEEEANRTFDLLRQMGQLGELDTPQEPER